MRRGSASSFPYGRRDGFRLAFAQLGSKILFRATDSVVDAELFVIDNGATATPVESGCGTAARFPILKATDPILGQTQQLVTESSQPGGAGLLLLGIPDETPLQPAPGCLAWVDMLSFWWPVDTWLVGAGAHVHETPRASLDLRETRRP